MVDDIPEHGDQAAIAVRYDFVRCADCGKTNNPPTVVVAKYPNPETPDDRLDRCQDCYAEILQDLTGLKGDIARVLALEVAGYSHSQIGFVLGKSTTKTEELAKQAREDDRKMMDRSNILEAIIGYI